MSEKTKRRQSSPGSTSATRERLLEAARVCVRRHGLAGASSREITTLADANLAAITYYFGSKDDLIAEALFGELERRVQPALAMLDAPGPAGSQLLSVVQALSEEFERSRKDTVVYFEALLLAVRDKRYRRGALELYQSLRRRLTDSVTELQDQGVVPAWVTPEATAGLILAIANGIALQSELDPDGPDHRAISAEFAQLLLAVSGSAGTGPSSTTPREDRSDG
jgi:AcrR family transcriptional regulator